MWGLSRNGDHAINFAVAAGGAMVASFSSLAGLAVWYVALPTVIARWRYRSIAWLCGALAITIPYTIGLRPTGTSGNSLGEFAVYVMAYIGSPLLRTPVGWKITVPAIVCGIAGVVLMVANVSVTLRRRQYLYPVLLWLEVAGFALACGVMTAFGRAGTFGVSQAMTSRYQIFSTFWWVALLVVMALVSQLCAFSSDPGWDWRRAVMRLNGALLPWILVALAFQNGLGFWEGYVFQRDQLQHQSCILHYRTAIDACFTYAIYPPSLVREGSAYLDKRHLGIFSGHR